ncbi:MAG: leucyl aminopeptidase [Bacteroidota bacterium]|jgi:leucyl aminopeptidase|nr:leucyl aminopeptidase [Ignavibacteria bacterium]MCU7498309.1 leucyl aminopeptidase [Ignavibacteria bacterium]MCU7512662.1 leucyl aminopeptidase [Ignavibacteria bacterium]MCU7520203.1 leucyl aminopeptidase [Ignavibacteria bacterium]MCU7523676.1 leucyl aminopeptidase [Ignavibacteria bacterium]
MLNIKFKNEGTKTSLLKDSLLMRFLFEDENLKKQLGVLENLYGISIPEVQRKNILSEKGSEIKIYNPDGLPSILILHKVKTKKDFSNDYFRNYFAGFISSLHDENVSNLQIVLPELSTVGKYFSDESYFYQTFIEGIQLGNYRFDKYMSEKDSSKTVTVSLYGNKAGLDEAIKNGLALMDGVCFARDLANEPSSVLTPAELAQRSKKELEKLGVKVTIYDLKDIQKRELGGILAVGRGSDNPQRLIVLNYKPAKAKKKIALVGKGVTFDSGGISIKPSAGMGEMKADMSGAAAVIGTFMSASKAGLQVELIGFVPAVENMPSGKAIKPGDIIKTASGKSIEVDNTDAEGRLILADALELAHDEKPDAIVDLATLTGACVVALGEYTAGLFTQDDTLAENLFQAGMNTFERLWRLPLWNEYNKLISSDVADVKNVGGKWAGAITAAKFLEKFTTGKVPWAHLDIAGPAIQNNLNNYTQKYMTGFGVRLLFEYLSKL